MRSAAPAATRTVATATGLVAVVPAAAAVTAPAARAVVASSVTAVEVLLPVAVVAMSPRAAAASPRQLKPTHFFDSALALISHLLRMIFQDLYYSDLDCFPILPFPFLCLFS